MIHWDLNPEIIKLFGIISLRYYSILFVLGLIIASKILESIFKKNNVSIERLDQLFFYVVIGTVIGARLGHCLFYEPKYYLNHLSEIFSPIRFGTNGDWSFVGFQGLASHGGALGILIVLFLYSKKNKINFLWLLDKIAIVAPLTGAFIRLGNFMNSEIIGKPTNNNFGVIFQKIDNVPRHPAQLYEAFFYLLIFVILIKIKNRESTKNNGYIFSLFLILVFTTRFFIEFIKINQVKFEHDIFLNMGQLLSIPFILIGIFLLKRTTNKRIVL